MDLQKLIHEVRMATLKLMVLSVEYLHLPSAREAENAEHAQESSRRINHYIETFLSALPPGVLQNISDSISNFDVMSEKVCAFIIQLYSDTYKEIPFLRAKEHTTMKHLLWSSLSLDWRIY